MARWARELPPWTEKYKTEPTINQSDSASFCTEAGKIGDKYLARAYRELPMAFRASIYADMLEREIIERYCDEHVDYPEPVACDD